MHATRSGVYTWLAIVLAACGGAGTASGSTMAAGSGKGAGSSELPWDGLVMQSSRPAANAKPVALVGGTVWTAEGRIIEDGVVVLEKGHIAAVGKRSDVEIPAGAQIIDTTGRHVTPGIIDVHSHLGVYASPSIKATDDGNEATAPVTAEVWAADSFWPQDPGLGRALAGGVTTLHVIPGSANLIGGRGIIVKTRPGRSISEVAFPNAPATLKMACGENPKRVYGDKQQAPSTRMGNVAGYRKAFQSAVEYRRSWMEWQKKHDKWQAKQKGSKSKDASKGKDDEDDDNEEPEPPARDFGLDTLAGVLEGKVLVQMHCYRADEMLRMLEIAKSFGFKIRSFHHAVEAYKIRDRLAAEKVGVNTWPDWWGFKLEAFDAIPENLALLEQAGVMTSVHSDSEMLVQRLNQEAGKAQAFGRRSGIEVDADAALRWITANPAWVLGIDKQTGTLEKGKMADVVVWSAPPLTVKAHADLVFIDGSLEYDRRNNPRGSVSDFEVGWEAGAR